jgi:hypothetical protein
MSLGDFFGGMIGAGATIGTSIMNNKAQKEINEQNIAMQKEINAANIAFQKEQNEITRLREDNSIQRRTADLKASGLNPLLAAGSGAQAQQMTAPRAEAAKAEAYRMNETAIAGAIMDGMKAKAEIDFTKAQTQKAKEEAEDIKDMKRERNARITNMEHENKERTARTGQIEIENAETIQGMIHKSQLQRGKVEGQNLSNEGQRLANEYNSITMESRIDEQAQRVKLLYQQEKSGKIDIINKELDAKIKQMEINPRDIDQILYDISKKGNRNLSAWELNFLAKAQALELALQAEKINNYNMKVAEGTGTKANQSVSLPASLGVVLGEIFGKNK